MASRILRPLALSWMVVAAAAVAAEGTVEPAYEMTVQDDRISLRVEDGKLVQIVEDLGQRLGFEVIAVSLNDYLVTAEFEALPVAEAIPRICKSVGYVLVPDATTGKIARLVLTPGKSSGANRLAARREPLSPRPAPPVEPPPVVEPPAEPKPEAKPHEQDGQGGADEPGDD